MRNEVSINGVKLTRKQVEDALAELNKPEPWIPQTGNEFAVPRYPGMIFKRYNSVVEDWLKQGSKYNDPIWASAYKRGCAPETTIYTFKVDETFVKV